jgi:hypothetical protein
MVANPMHNDGPRCAQESKKLLEEKFRTGKNRWFFNKLRF